MNEQQEEKWYLPEALDVTKSESALSRSIELRKQLAPRAISPFARLSSQEFERVRAADRITHIADDLHRVDEELKTERGRDSVEKLKEARIALAHRLAENLAIVGRYDLASELEPDPEQRKEYAAILSALVLDDSYSCKCAPGRLYVKQWIFSQKHKRMMPLLACSGCGMLNVSPLPDDLLKQKQAREKARELVEGKTPEEAAKILKAADLTSEKVIPR